MKKFFGCIKFLFFVSIGFIYLQHSNLIAQSYNLVAANKTIYAGSLVTLTNESARGFCYFTAGVIFNGTINWHVPTPLEGSIQLGNGSSCTLNLESDLVITSSASTDINRMVINTTNGSATISGNGNSIETHSDFYLPPNRNITFSSNTTWDGGGHDLYFDTNTSFSVLTGVTLIIRDCHLRGLRGENHFFGPGKLEIYNSFVTLENDWTYSGNATVAAPELAVDDFLRFYGIGKKFIYANGKNFTIKEDGCVIFDAGTTFSWISPRRNGLIMNAVNSILFFNGSDFFIGSRGPLRGLQLTTGTLLLDNKVTLNNDGWLTTSRSLEWGNGVAANDLNVRVLAGACVAVNGFIYQNTGV